MKNLYLAGYRVENKQKSQAILVDFAGSVFANMLIVVNSVAAEHWVGRSVTHIDSCVTCIKEGSRPVGLWTTHSHYY